MRARLSCLLLAAGFACFVEAGSACAEEEADAAEAHSVGILQELLDNIGRAISDRIGAATELLWRQELSERETEVVHEWLSEETEPWVRFRLLTALMNQDGIDPATVLDYLDDPDPTIRAIAAGSAHWAPDELESRLLLLYSAEDYWWVRVPVIEALADSFSDESLEVLHQALTDPAPEVASAALRLINERADPRSAEPLRTAHAADLLVWDETPMDGLAAIGDIASIPLMEEAAASPYPRVRGAAARGLLATRSRESAAPACCGLR